MKSIIDTVKLLLSLYQKIFYKEFWLFSYIKSPNYIINKKMITVGKKVIIDKYSFIYLVTSYGKKIYTPTLCIWNNVWIWQNLTISCMGKIIIEDSVMMSRNVFIGDGIHDYQDISKPIIEQNMLYKGDVHIKKGAFIGINAVIMPGITIWKNAVVWANSVVTKDVPDFSVVAWSPAKIIKQYNEVKGGYFSIKK